LYEEASENEKEIFFLSDKSKTITKQTILEWRKRG